MCIGTHESHMYKRAEWCPYVGFFLVCLCLSVFFWVVLSLSWFFMIFLVFLEKYKEIFIFTLCVSFFSKLFLPVVLVYDTCPLLFLHFVRDAIMLKIY